MDDDKKISSENQLEPSSEQPRPIFETTPLPEVHEQEVESQNQALQDLKAEEISPEVESPEQVVPPQEPPANDGGNKKRLFLLGGASLAFLIIFILIIRFIFGLFSGASKKEVKLSYWGLWEEKAVLDPLIQQYQARNKHVKIDYQKMSVQDYREKLVARSKNGQGPDIFRFHNTWIPEIKEVVTSLPASIMDNNEFERTFYPVHKKDLKIGDHYYGIPLTVDGLILIYNESLFKKAGISSPPTTWEELIDYATKLSVKDKDGKIITSGIALGVTSNIEHFSDIFGLFLIQNGGDIKKLDQIEAAQALEAYRKFAEPPNNVWDESMPNSVSAFIQEKVAMIIAPSWEILAIKNANPELSLKAASIPVIPGFANKPVSLASYWVEGVSKLSKSERQIEAWKFLKFLSEKENLTKLYEIESKTRLFGEPYSRKDLAVTLSQNEYAGVVIKQADSLVSQPLISRTYDNGLNDEIIKYIENAINATAQGVSYEEAMRTASEGVNQVLTRFGVQ